MRGWKGWPVSGHRATPCWYGIEGVVTPPAVLTSAPLNKKRNDWISRALLAPLTLLLLQVKWHVSHLASVSEAGVMSEEAETTRLSLSQCCCRDSSLTAGGRWCKGQQRQGKKTSKEEEVNPLWVYWSPRFLIKAQFVSWPRPRPPPVTSHQPRGERWGFTQQVRSGGRWCFYTEGKFGLPVWQRVAELVCFLEH